MGMALLAAPLLALVDPALVPGPALCAVMVLSAVVAWRERGTLDIHMLAPAILGLLFGTAIGAGLLAVLVGWHLAQTFAVLILGAVLLSVLGLPIRAGKLTLLLGGVASGVSAPWRASMARRSPSSSSTNHRNDCAACYVPSSPSAARSPCWRSPALESSVSQASASASLCFQASLSASPSRRWSPAAIDRRRARIAVLDHLRAQRSGTVVPLTSVFGIIGNIDAIDAIDAINIIGSSVHRLIGSSAHRLIGSSAHRLIGSSVHRFNGSSVSSVHRFIGSIGIGGIIGVGQNSAAHSAATSPAALVLPPGQRSPTGHPTQQGDRI